jgi:hypothetical protein
MDDDHDESEGGLLLRGRGRRSQSTARIPERTRRLPLPSGAKTPPENMTTRQVKKIYAENCFRRAAERLETMSQLEELLLFLTYDAHPSRTLPYLRRNFGSFMFFRRFVNALQRHGRLRKLTMDGFILDEDVSSSDSEADSDDVSTSDDAEASYGGDGESGTDEEEEAVAAGAGRQRIVPVVPWDSVRIRFATELERLFGTVLPNHSSLTEIVLGRCQCRWIELFASSFPTARPLLERLVISRSRVTRDCVEALATMIRRDVPIERLDLTFLDLDAEAAKTIFDSVVENRHLRSLRIVGHRYHINLSSSEDLCVRALSTSSPLTDLAVDADWSFEDFAALLACLRTNTVMENLRIGAPRGFAESNIAMSLIEDLLSTYNWTLRWFNFSIFYVFGLRKNLGWHEFYPRYHIPFCAIDPRQDRINALLRVNDGVRRAMEQLEAQQYRLGPSILPGAIERFRGRPTPVYRLLRRGNVEAFSEHLMREVADVDSA